MGQPESIAIQPETGAVRITACDSQVIEVLIDISIELGPGGGVVDCCLGMLAIWR